MTPCQNCQHPVTGKYCSNCGQALHLKRIDRHYISHEILHLLHFEKGFFYTVKALLVSPGHSIREFIHQNRAKHMKPVPFIIITSLIFTVLSHLFHVDKLYNSMAKIDVALPTVAKIQNWIQTHYGYANILMGGFMALCILLFFRKYRYNLFEITILMCFVMGQSMLLLAVEAFFIPVLNIKSYSLIMLLITFGYSTWAIGQFFDSKKVMSYVKAFFAYLLGYFLFNITLAAIGISIDLLMK
ncbi:MAG: DUF3667 domain-containing protein [Sediminibacterium sp.]|nr:DUF3667 domain-containing protein [Sediminibacterium sp.]